MTKLSVNINKIALIRNSRRGDNPNLLEFISAFETLGADGITVHPRPDERHIRYDDLGVLAAHIQTEFNVEGAPSNFFIRTMCALCPTQVTLVPDAPDALTSDAGFDIIAQQQFLSEVVQKLQEKNIRVSIFVDANISQIEAAARIGANCIELYTGPYAQAYAYGQHESILAQHKEAAHYAHDLGLRVHAGHDLNLDNLALYLQELKHVSEVSIGHALTIDLLRFGLSECLQKYLAIVKASCHST